MEDGTYDLSYGGYHIGKAKVTMYATSKDIAAHLCPAPMQASFLTDADIQIMAVLTGEMERWRYRAYRQCGNPAWYAALMAGEKVVCWVPPAFVTSRN